MVSWKASLRSRRKAPASSIAASAISRRKLAGPPAWVRRAIASRGSRASSRLGHPTVGVAERHALGHQAQGLVRGEDLGGEGGQEPRLVHFQFPEGQVHHPHTGDGGLEAVEEGALGLLEVAVVARGQGLDDAEHLVVAGDDGRGPRADQFEPAGVAFLGHDAAAGAQLLGNPEVAKLRQAEIDEVLGHAAQVDGDLDTRAQDDRLDLPAAVVGIEDVVLEPGEAEGLARELAVYGQGHAVTGGRAEGALVVEFVGGAQEPQVVQDALEPGAGPQAHARGHGHLGVGAADHGDVLVGLGELPQGRREVQGRGEEGVERVLGPQAECRDDLVVA